MPALLRNFRTFSLEKKLWLSATCVALFIVTLVVSNFFQNDDRAVGRNMLGHDFQVFYTAGHFVNEGRSADLYDLEKVKEFEAWIGETYNLDVGKGFGPIWNPPFFCWIFASLAQFDYPTALSLWFAFSFVVLAMSCGMLMSQLDGRAKWLVPILVLSSMPFIQAISHGQNTFLSLLILTAAVMCWRSKQNLLAGLIAGLLFYKPQLGAAVALVLAVTAGRRAILGLAITGTALLLINVFTLPGTIGAFLHQMPINLRFMQEDNVYLWERHVTLKSFWRLLIQGYHVGPTWPIVQAITYLSLIALAGALAMLAWRTIRHQTPRSLDRLIAATICAMPLLMPFYFDYDLLLLTVPATLLAIDLRREGLDPFFKSDRWLIRAWFALFFATMLNAGTARLTHFNLTVPALVAVNVCMIVRAWRLADVAQTPRIVLQPELRQAA